MKLTCAADVPESQLARVGIARREIRALPPRNYSICRWLHKDSECIDNPMRSFSFCVSANLSNLDELALASSVKVWRQRSSR